MSKYELLKQNLNSSIKNIKRNNNQNSKSNFLNISFFPKGVRVADVKKSTTLGDLWVFVCVGYSLICTKKKKK